MKKILLAVGMLISTIGFSQKIDSTYNSDTVRIVQGQQAEDLAKRSTLVFSKPDNVSVLTITHSGKQLRFVAVGIKYERVIDNDGCYNRVIKGIRLPDQQEVSIILNFNRNNILLALGVGDENNFAIFNIVSK